MQKCPDLWLEHFPASLEGLSLPLTIPLLFVALVAECFIH